ncbi:MAG: tRNA (N6-threonylcarbamoyladenosine(37)-N6)-methyltransferase TrmO [Promethearchaeati archaeon]
MSMDKFSIRPIGIVKNDKDAEMLKYANEDIELDPNRLRKQGHALGTSEIIVYDDYVECLDGIEDFSHLMVLYWTHKTPEEARNIKKVHPAGLQSMPVKGIFATRSPVRPNPLALISVKLIKREHNRLIVEGLDAINRSPVIDIKPHLPSYDSPLDVKLADWMYSLMDEFRKLNQDDSDDSQHIDMRAHPCISFEQKTLK